jgi:hypothetical protein
VKTVLAKARRLRSATGDVVVTCTKSIEDCDKQQLPELCCEWTTGDISGGKLAVQRRNACWPNGCLLEISPIRACTTGTARMNHKTSVLNMPDLISARYRSSKPTGWDEVS